MFIAPAYVTTLYLPTEEGEGEGSTPVRKKTRVASVCQWSKKAKLAIRPKLFTFNTLYTFFTFFPFSFFYLSALFFLLASFPGTCSSRSEAVM